MLAIGFWRNDIERFRRGGVGEASNGWSGNDDEERAVTRIGGCKVDPLWGK